MPVARSFRNLRGRASRWAKTRFFPASRQAVAVLEFKTGKANISGFARRTQWASNFERFRLSLDDKFFIILAVF